MATREEKRKRTEVLRSKGRDRKANSGDRDPEDSWPSKRPELPQATLLSEDWGNDCGELNLLDAGELPEGCVTVPFGEKGNLVLYLGQLKSEEERQSCYDPFCYETLTSPAVLLATLDELAEAPCFSTTFSPRRNAGKNQRWAKEKIPRPDLPDPLRWPFGEDALRNIFGMTQ
jgi:hypothetical protein